MCHRRRYDSGATEVLVVRGCELRNAGSLYKLEEARLPYTLPKEYTLVLAQ